MASRTTKGGASAPPTAAPLDVLLGAIPSLSRPALALIVERAIDRIDAIDGDPDLDESVEDGPLGFDPEEDMCLAGDDRIQGGSCTGASLLYEETGPGDDTDAEEDGLPIRRPFTRKTRARACSPIYRRGAWGGRAEIERYELDREPIVPSARTLIGENRRKT